MAVPSSKDARLFYQCAKHRRHEAGILYEADCTTAAVYLAGYGVECILKALLLAETPQQLKEGVLADFRGAKAHDFEWLRSRYLINGGSRFPKEITRAFLVVSEWTTEMRYRARSLKHSEAHDFLLATDTIIRWAEGRF